MFADIFKKCVLLHAYIYICFLMYRDKPPGKLDVYPFPSPNASFTIYKHHHVAFRSETKHS